ncbi:unnamed protein product [Protopolystoma xenopodis]|uniref:Uncharacterized protein n=1 Tax=Protopolystoma xenopodis TaxID=117903 RepID=A0A448XJS8_9PLAT|nr:unnamed protein product [Protopolystoma xenopodis]
MLVVLVVASIISIVAVTVVLVVLFRLTLETATPRDGSANIRFGSARLGPDQPSLAWLSRFQHRSKPVCSAWRSIDESSQASVYASPFSGRLSLSAASSRVSVASVPVARLYAPRRGLGQRSGADVMQSEKAGLRQPLRRPAHASPCCAHGIEKADRHTDRQTNSLHLHCWTYVFHLDRVSSRHAQDDCSRVKNALVKQKPPFHRLPSTCPFARPPFSPHDRQARSRLTVYPSISFRQAVALTSPVVTARGPPRSAPLTPTRAPPPSRSESRLGPACRTLGWLWTSSRLASSLSTTVRRQVRRRRGDRRTYEVAHSNGKVAQTPAPSARR